MHAMVATMMGLGGCNCPGCNGGCGGGGDCARGNCEGSGFPGNCPEPEGPTDPHIRCAGCRWVEQLGVSGMDEGLSLRGRVVPGFGLGAGNPNVRIVDVYSSLTPAQQTWVQSALGAWLADPNVLSWIASNPCQGVTQGMVLSNTTALYAVIPCFQEWFNTQASQGGTINAQGVLDQQTLAALMATEAQASWGAAVGGCPGSCGITPSGGGSSSSTSSSTTMYWVAGGIAVVLAGGLLYVMNRRTHAAAA